MNSPYSLNHSFDLLSGFWKPENESEVITGTLSSHEGRLEFLTSPTFSRLSQEDELRVWAQFGSPVREIMLDSVCGYTSEGRCTLLHLSQLSGAGLTDLSNKIALTADRWYVSASVMGLHLDSSQAEAIDGAGFYLTKISNFLPHPWGLQMTEAGFTYTSPNRAPSYFEFDSEGFGAEVICEVFAGKQMKSVPRIRILPHRPKSVDWFFGIGLRLENFFALLLGTSVALKRVQLFKGKESGWLVRRVRARSEKINLQKWVRCQPDTVARGLERWLLVPEEQRPVERTVLGMVRKSSLFVETEFLALAQALEGFGRIRFDEELIPKDKFKEGLAKMRPAIEQVWGKSEIGRRCSEALTNANDATFGQRLEHIYDLLSTDLAKRLLGERQQFVREVVQTRNYFTHLGIRKGAAVVNDVEKLFLLNRRLHALLRGVTLMDLGFSEAEISGPMLYEARK